MLAGLRLSSTSYVVCVVGFWDVCGGYDVEGQQDSAECVANGKRGREESCDALNIGANHVARMCPYVYGVISVLDAFITVQFPHTAHPTLRDSGFSTSVFPCFVSPLFKLFRG